MTPINTLQQREKLPLNRRHSVIKCVFAPFVPYFFVGVGLFVFHNAWVAMLGYHAGMMITLFVDNASDFYRLRQSRKPALAGVAVAAGLSSGLFLYLLMPVLSLPENIHSSYLETVGLTRGVVPFFLVYFLLVNPALEECYWRGYLGSNTKRPVLNDIMFAGYHILVIAGMLNIWLAIAAFAVLVLSAWSWRQIDRLSQGLLPSYLSHLAVDISVMLVLYFTVVKGLLS